MIIKPKPSVVELDWRLSISGNSVNTSLPSSSSCLGSPVRVENIMTGAKPKVKKTRKTRGKFLFDGKAYRITRELPHVQYYRCVKEKLGCSGTLIIRNGVPTIGNYGHSCIYEDDERVRDEAIERLRELTVAAADGAKATDIVRTLLKELSPEVRAMVPDRDSLCHRVRRWARGSGVNLVRSTFDDYLVEDGLDSEIPPPPPAQSKIKLEPTPGPSSGSGDSVPLKESGPEIIFLKGRGGEKHRLMIDQKLYIYIRDLAEKGASLYQCNHARFGCRVTVKMFREEKHYEIRGEHVHREKAPPQPPKNKLSKGNSLKLVDEAGRDLGHVSVDHVLTAGEDSAKLRLDYDNLTRDSVGENSEPHATSSFSADDRSRDVHNEELQNNDDFMDFNDGPVDDDFGGDDDDFSEAVPVVVPQTVSPVLAAKLVEGNILPASSLVNCKNTFNKGMGGKKTGERCFVCGDELVVSETLASNGEVFRKACCYLNVRSKGEWFPKDPGSNFYSFCESCTNEVLKINQLYKKLEEIQSLIFKRVENVEKRIADAEIVDNWMAEVPVTSAKRFEGFRKEVLINYRNKLKLRREVRVGRKLGQNLIEIQPIPSPHMFTSDPSESDSRIVPQNVGRPRTRSSSIHSTTAETSAAVAKRGKGRPTSKKQVVEDESTQCEPPLQFSPSGGEFSGGLFNDEDNGGDCQEFDDGAQDDAISITSEREVKFWESDPNKLRIDNDNDNDANDNEKKGGGSTKNKRFDGDDSDPDYEEDDDDDEDWDTKKTKRNAGSRSTGKKRGRPAGTSKPTNKTAAFVVLPQTKSMQERMAEARAARTAARQKQEEEKEKNKEDMPTDAPENLPKKKQHSLNFEFPDAVLMKDGRVFMSGVEIIKNPLGAMKGCPRSISFTCSVCGKIIKSFLRMKQHICGHHLGFYKCEICGKEMADPKTLRRHVEWTHEKPSSKVPCPICEKPINANPEARALEHHQWSHLSEEEKKLPMYKRWCPPNKNPNRRKRENEQTFMCSLCPKRFYRQDTCRNHELTHTGDGNQGTQCPYCGKMFKNRKSFYGHNKNCTDLAKGLGHSPSFQDTLPCPKCSVRFKSRTTRAKHIRRFHSNKDAQYGTFSCPKCKRNFGNKNTFKQHRRHCTAPSTKSGPVANSSSLDDHPSHSIDYGESMSEHKVEHGEPYPSTSGLSTGGPVPGAYLGDFNYSAVFCNYQGDNDTLK